MNEPIERRLIVLATEVVQAAFSCPALKAEVALLYGSHPIDAISVVYGILTESYDREGFLNTHLSDETELVLYEAATRFVIAAYKEPEMLAIVDGHLKLQPNSQRNLSSQIHAVWIAFCNYLDREPGDALAVHPHSRSLRSPHGIPPHR